MYLALLDLDLLWTLTSFAFKAVILELLIKIDDADDDELRNVKLYNNNA